MKWPVFVHILISDLWRTYKSSFTQTDVQLFVLQHLKTPPQSVVLVGHSMGGVVARALFTLPRFNPHLVTLIITQASPHLAPVLALDPYLLGEHNSPPSVHDGGLFTHENMEALLSQLQSADIFMLFFSSLCLWFIDFYSAVRQKWVYQANKLRNITVVSVGGGYRDYQVRSGLTSLPCPPGDSNKLSLVVWFVYEEMVFIFLNFRNSSQCLVFLL